MNLRWLKAGDIVKVATSLADQFVPQQPVPDSFAHGRSAAQSDVSEALQRILPQVYGEVRALQLNLYRRAKFANSFKWRLRERGVNREIADEVTQELVLHLSRQPAIRSEGSGVAPKGQTSSTNAKYLLEHGNDCFARGAYSEAVTHFRKLVELDPRSAAAMHKLGSALNMMGLLMEAEQCFRGVLELKPDSDEAHCSLGIVLRAKGEIVESEVWLRRALRLAPKKMDARINLGVTLLSLGRLREAKACFAKVLNAAPLQTDALFLTGHIAKLEGRFEEAESRFKRALAVDPKMPNAWAALVGTRKMTAMDAAWLKGAKEIAASKITPTQEAELRFAMGKYYDDLNDFGQAFEHYKRGNELMKSMTENYDQKERTRFVDDLIRVYTAQAISAAPGSASDSMKPVFVVGMPRSGTSLAEQIIASHPAAKGAGELGFCGDVLLAPDSGLRRGILPESTRKGLAQAYLRALESRSGDAQRIVDKAPVNSDYLGVINSVFPNARIIYMRRDPLDTCLSCYFQHFSVALNFTMELSDLAHYFREHQRLMAHWLAVLPPRSILEVPYAGLVEDQEGWTRKILDFLELEWNERCLDYHKVTRQVVTASAWQVRQKIYKDSVGRWRNYEKFIGPLLQLRD